MLHATAVPKKAICGMSLTRLLCGALGMPQRGCSARLLWMCQCQRQCYLPCKCCQHVKVCLACGSGVGWTAGVAAIHSILKHRA